MCTLTVDIEKNVLCSEDIYQQIFFGKFHRYSMPSVGLGLRLYAYIRKPLKPFLFVRSVKIFKNRWVNDENKHIKTVKPMTNKKAALFMITYQPAIYPANYCKKHNRSVCDICDVCNVSV